MMSANSHILKKQTGTQQHNNNITSNIIFIAINVRFINVHTAYF